MIIVSQYQKFTVFKNQQKCIIPIFRENAMVLRCLHIDYFHFTKKIAVFILSKNIRENAMVLHCLHIDYYHFTKKNAVFILSKKNRENTMVMRCLSLDNFHFTRFFPIHFSYYVDDWVSHYLNFSEYPNI